MFKIACLFDINYDDHAESKVTYLEKTFPTVKEAEYHARRRMESRKYRDAFTLMMGKLGCRKMQEFCMVVNESNEPVNDHNWVYSEETISK